MKKKENVDDEPFIPPDMLNRQPQLIEDQLQTTVEQDSNIRTVSKELFNEQGIDLKSEVTHNEINDITRIRFLHEQFGIDSIDPLLKSFLRLRVSKERKSRKEFVEIVQTENRNAQGGGFLSKIMGRNKDGGNT